MDKEMLIFYGLILVSPLLAWGVSALFSRKKYELTGYATVKSHRVGRNSSWNYLICFELSDGSELELLTTKGDYQTLKDGQSGQVTWENGQLYHFDPDTPQ